MYFQLHSIYQRYRMFIIKYMNANFWVTQAITYTYWSKALRYTQRFLKIVAVLLLTIQQQWLEQNGDKNFYFRIKKNFKTHEYGSYRFVITCFVL